MNNTTALNETNQTSWQVSDITSVQKIFIETQKVCSELLTSWDMIPEDIYFRLLITLLGVVGICFLIIKGSNFISGGLKLVLVGLLIIVIFIAFGII